MIEREYGFKEPPFSEDSFAYPMVNREKEWTRLLTLTERSLAAHGSRTILLLGDYGFGKSFMLEKLAEALAKHQVPGSSNSLVASIRIAESEPEAKIGLSFVSKIFYDLGFQTLVSVAKKYARTSHPIPT